MIVRVAAGPVDTRPPRTVRSIDELAALARVPLLRSIAPEPPLVLGLPQMSPTEARVWEAKLNREWTSCGCRSGEIAVMLALAGYGAATLAGLGPDVGSMWGHAGWAAVAALAAAAAGKITGRARSLSRFRRLARDIETAAAPRG